MSPRRRAGDRTAPWAPPTGRLRRWIPRRVAVRGGSMAPTLADGDVVVVLPARPVRAGRVALVRWADRPAQLSVKRLALPLGDDGWFAVGDAPGASTDSRTLGPAQALAPVVWRLAPRPGPVR